MEYGIILGRHCHHWYTPHDNATLPLIAPKVCSFADHELSVRLDGPLPPQLLIATSTYTHEHLLELLLLAQAAVRQGVHAITAFVAYMGYSRQPETLKLMVELMRTAGIQQVLTLDLHHPAASPYIINLPPLWSADLLSPTTLPPVIIAPDQGAAVRAREVAQTTQAELILLTKQRTSNNHCLIHSQTEPSDLRHRECIIVDDIIDSGHTLSAAAAWLRQRGATTIKAWITHPVLATRDAAKQLSNSGISQLVISDSRQLTDHERAQFHSYNIALKVVSVWPALKTTLKNL